MSARNRFNVLDNLMHCDYDRALSVYPLYFDFALLTMTAFTSLCEILFNEKISVEIVSGSSHEPNVNIVTSVKGKALSKGKANFEYSMTSTELHFNN